MHEFLRKLFVYDKWAIDRSVASLERPANSRALRMLSHILLGEKIWLTRLNGQDSLSIPTFSELSLVECSRLSDELHSAYLRYIDSLTNADLDTIITYKNTKGIEFHTSIKDILIHVGLHAVYHRGQVAMLVKDGGGQAIGTDYILFTRL
jgi:uncharacterized damage-inducible protein DinB